MAPVAGMTFATRPPGIYILGGGGVVSDKFFHGATCQFVNDGTVTGTTYTGDTTWAATPAPGVGNSYWIKLTKTGGTRSVTSEGAWVALSGSPTFQVVGGAGNCTGIVEFATDSSGTGSPLGSGNTFSVNNTL